MSSKHVEQSSAAAIASKINSFTRPWIDENRSRTFRATCASAQHKTINAELMRRSVKDIFHDLRARNSFWMPKFSFWFSWETFNAELSAKNNFHFFLNFLEFSLIFHYKIFLNLICIKSFIDFRFAMQLFVVQGQLNSPTRENFFILRSIPFSQTHWI